MDARLKYRREGERGSIMVEASVAMIVLIVLVFGIVEFSYAFYQWNSATKAVQMGARTAAVSTPVAGGLDKLNGLSGGTLPGASYPAGEQFLVTCSGSSQTCVCSNAKCGGYSFTYEGAAMARILGAMQKAYPANDAYAPKESNVVIRYEYTGLGYAGRPGGPVPTITVTLTGMTFNFVLLSGIMPKGAKINMPAFATTVTGEDLFTSGSS